jgi:hypothetical protein
MNPRSKSKRPFPGSLGNGERGRKLAARRGRLVPGISESCAEIETGIESAQ